MIRKLVAALAMLVASAAPALAQDMLIRGGTIYTGVESAPTAEAVLVRDGRIVFVGDLAGVAALGDAPVVDLKGAALFPGFTDGHVHLDGIGQRELTLNLEGAASLAEAMQRLRAWAQAHPDGPIIGRGWIETHWPEGRFLTRQDLDAAAPGRVVLLSRADGHALTASSAALQSAGITRDTAAPSGGQIARDAAGQPTGFLLDAAMDLIARLRPAQSEARRRQVYQAGFRVAANYGWTGVHFMSAPFADVPLLERMAAQGQAPIRVYNSIDLGPGGRDARALIAQGPRSTPDGRIITRAIKVYADGALGARGAALFAPYADAPETRGLMLTSRQEVLPIYQAAFRRGIQVATHAIGDRGNAEVLAWCLEAMGAVNGSEPKVRDARWRIEHAQIVRPGDRVLFARIPVIASMQPSHAISDLHFAPARLGDARLDGAYAWRSFTDLGVIVVGGSDAPVERGDPLIEFYAAIARRDLNGFQGPDWRPHEAVSRETALKMFTLWPAYASFREDELGTIEVGKRADFSAFSVDLMTAEPADIPRAKAVLTVVDGVVVHDAR